MASATGKPKRTVHLGQRMFDSRDALVVYFRTILRGNKNGYRLTGEEFETAKALLKEHPRWEEKIGDSGLLYIIVGANPKFPDTPSFIVVRSDKTQSKEDFSYLKIADKLFPEEGKERRDRKKPLSGILCRIRPVPQSCEKELRRFLEGPVGVNQRHLGRDPIIRDDHAVVQFVDPDDLTALITAPAPKFRGQTLTVELLQETDKYWAERKFERQQKADEKEMKLAKKAMRGRGRGGFRGGGRGGFGGRGGGGFGGDRDGGGFGGGGYGGGAKRYGDDSGHSDGPGAKRMRTD